MKSSSSGSARVVIGSRVRRLPKVRRRAQRTIGPACSATRAYHSAASSRSEASVAGPRAELVGEPGDHAPRAGADDQHDHQERDDPSQAQRRDGRRARRSGTK